MEIYKLKDFARWAADVGLDDEKLLSVVNEMNRGLTGNCIGAAVYKKRIGIRGRGKRGGSRSLILFKQDQMALFLYGYIKNEKDSLEPREEEAVKVFAKRFMQLSYSERLSRIESGAIVRIGKGAE